jgi:DNA modification methylase
LLWLNIGDAYNTSINWRLEDSKYSTLGENQNGLGQDNSAYTKDRGQRRVFTDKEDKWLKEGNLLGIPYRIIISLCDKAIYYRGEIIWQKSNPMPEGRTRRPHRKHEGIYIFANSIDHDFTISPPVPSVWQIQNNKNGTSHTSSFPVDLPVKCIRASNLTEGIVLDPFMGSGTVGVAAKRLGLDYIGFDVDVRNVNTSNTRIHNTLTQTGEVNDKDIIFQNTNTVNPN